MSNSFSLRGDMEDFIYIRFMSKETVRYYYFVVAAMNSLFNQLKYTSFHLYNRKSVI